jgi:hypothetical protein
MIFSINIWYSIIAFQHLVFNTSGSDILSWHQETIL